VPRGRIEGVVTAAAIAAVLVGLAALPAGAVSTTPKNGAWTGVGQDDMQIGFEVTHHRLEASWGPQTRIYVHYKTTTCSAAGTVNAPPVTPDADGRFTVTQGNDTVKGRFTSPTRVRGKFTHVQTTTCTPGTYVYKFVGRRFPK
jgi:hypothetical protein